MPIRRSRTPPKPPARVPRRSPDDPAEVIERVLSRRRLVLRPGDVLIERTATTGFASNTVGQVYRLCVEGQRILPERYATFDRAALEGERLASMNHVSLFYRDSKSEPLYLLRDCR